MLLRGSFAHDAGADVQYHHGCRVDRRKQQTSRFVYLLVVNFSLGPKEEQAVTVMQGIQMSELSQLNRLEVQLRLRPRLNRSSSGSCWSMSLARTLMSNLSRSLSWHSRQSSRQRG